LPIEEVLSGPLGRIQKYRKASNGRCPTDDFFKSCHPNFIKKFHGEFRSIVLHKGAEYVNGQRFTPLKGDGKPLWEFKQFDNRLYCIRDVDGPCVTIMLLSGWIKDKEGKSKQERTEIVRAIDLLKEYTAEKGLR